MEAIFMNTENIKSNELHKFVFKFSTRILNKHVALQILPNCYTWKNIRQQYKTKKLKKTTPTRNGGFQLII